MLLTPGYNYAQYATVLPDIKSYEALSERNILEQFQTALNKNAHLKAWAMSMPPLSPDSQKELKLLAADHEFSVEFIEAKQSMKILFTAIDPKQLAEGLFKKIQAAIRDAISLGQWQMNTNPLSSDTQKELRTLAAQYGFSVEFTTEEGNEIRQPYMMVKFDADDTIKAGKRDSEDYITGYMCLKNLDLDLIKKIKKMEADLLNNPKLIQAELKIHPQLKERVKDLTLKTVSWKKFSVHLLTKNDEQFIIVRRK